ncbi:ACP S-malonyltransferase [Streptomyces boncukensis]|uniref:[acyl-carrier-protein] S-malonyltransferase n=1 Tax=Streptomyces boncukensis TaxID=2711219 RepID=A0A6G4X3V4_9ACTN|nr:acyltransferase domain-containing protein [Streptomyces boncukensis]NGO72219.1 acyltransferase domain-containing protein [Streptomyces boncukensis]
MSIAFLFPGQGAQRPGMLHRLPDTAASATVLAEAEWGHPGGIAELDTAEALENSQVARDVALLTAGVAGARALMEDEAVRPSCVAGHGLGGYAAAVASGVLTFEEALRAVRLRAELLERAEEPPPDLAIRLAQHLATVKRRPQALPYVSGTLGRCLRADTNAVFDDLAGSVALPVLWEQVVAVLRAEGTALCVELPPGRTLTALLTEGSAAVRAVSVEEQGLAEAAEAARAAG